LLTKESKLKEREIRTEKLKEYIAVGGLVALVGICILLSTPAIKNEIGQAGNWLKKDNEISKRGQELKSQAEELTRLNTTKVQTFFPSFPTRLRGPLILCRFAGIE